jgi:ABC-type multidrug transport system fused ATPase/permease subunit
MYNGDFNEFVKQAKNGEILIGVEPAVARRFFTDSDKNIIRQLIGESLSVKQFLVKLVWILEYVTLFVGIIVSIFAIHWYSFIAIPLMIVISFILGGKASAGAQRLGGGYYICYSICYTCIYVKRKRYRNDNVDFIITISIFFYSYDI